MIIINKIVFVIKMVYKIRNKAFNNFGPSTNTRVYTAKKTKTQVDLTKFVTFQVHITRFSQMRLYQNYRLISRAMKQFLMGDKILEQIIILELKN